MDEAWELVLPDGGTGMPYADSKHPDKKVRVFFYCPQPINRRLEDEAFADNV
ncbi:hypothetical protein [Rossellomorea vietnamensis]|uniref:hypothetical protein n=1 Tax=Rossellomorea vietnamensis TaxID=218284 RepID=UPI00165395F4|nr:hypothetical protein [Rossellomorea vietnamensis]